MSDLLYNDHSLLLVLSRFGIHLGFGTKTVSEVCESSNVNTYTFLAVVNFLSFRDFDAFSLDQEFSISTVVDYLENAHKYFLTYKLPSIREKLSEAVTKVDTGDDYKILFLNFFDDYVNEVKRHMEYENNIVFPYAKKLSEGMLPLRYSISVFEKRHNEIDSRLQELTSILIKYFPDQGTNYLLTEVLFDILSCQADIVSHNKVEDYLFIPVVQQFENQLRAL